MMNISASSVLPIVKVKVGGIKKKFQTNALKRAATNTGPISKNIATRETVTNNRSATTLYSINEDKRKQIPATTRIKAILIVYCAVLLLRLNSRLFIACK
jgi:hypothetical protein